MTSSTTPSPGIVGVTRTASPSVAISLSTRLFLSRPRNVQRSVSSALRTQKNPLCALTTVPIIQCSSIRTSALPDAPDPVVPSDSSSSYL